MCYSSATLSRAVPSPAADNVTYLQHVKYAVHLWYTHQHTLATAHSCLQHKPGCNTLACTISTVDTSGRRLVPKEATDSPQHGTAKRLYSTLRPSRPAITHICQGRSSRKGLLQSARCRDRPIQASGIFQSLMSTKHSPTAPRSLSGCWTCRLRRKKCDEVHPCCQTCTNLELDCSGYGSKPNWMDGHSTQALLQHDIKMQVKKTKSRKRHVRSPKLAHDKRLGSVASAEDSFSHGILIYPDRSSVSVGVSEGSLRSFGDDFALRFRQDWDGTRPRSILSDGPRGPGEAYVNTMPAFGGGCREQFLLRYFWAHVFASHFAFLPFSVAHSGRKWLSSTIATVQPLSDLTLALSACHCYIKTPLSILKDELTWRYYYDHGLKGLRFRIRSFRKVQSLQGIRGALQLLACNMQLILLDLLRGLRTWLVHLRGMSGLMDMVVAFALSRESKELGGLDQTGLEFIVQAFNPLNRASAMLKVGIPSYDRTQ